jgi:DNA-directed RNA polymerase subunit RPC12/RpoP
MLYCTLCGKQISDEFKVCDECSSQPTVKSRPFADPVVIRQTFDPLQTNPLEPLPLMQQVQALHSPQIAQNLSRCPYCGGAGGIAPKSKISTAGFVYMGIMFTITFFVFIIFFPCALIPFGLIFLGLLFKETHFACINCGQKIS